MPWNWQQPDWPNFTWDQDLLANAERHFLVGSGVFVGIVGHLGSLAHDQLIVESISSEALTTSAIEGEILDRVSVQTPIRRQLGMVADAGPVPPAEQGIAEMMVDLYRGFARPLDDNLLFSWHGMLMRGRDDLSAIARYRSETDSMQVVSGTFYAPRVHFEAPPSTMLSSEMDRFIAWFNRTAPGGAEPLPTLTRAGIAHLYFVCIHPFEDGNGRVGRAIAEKALAQTLGQPALTALAATILAKRKGYYDALERANKDNEITGWLTWFAATAIEAQRHALTLVQFLIDKARLLDDLRDRLNERQGKALLRMLREGPEGFRGELSAGNYQRITGASPATATRDLADMVEMGALVRSGERRHAHYSLGIPLRPVARVRIDRLGMVVEE